MDFHAGLREAVPIDATPMHRRDFMAKARTTAGSEIQHDLLGAAEV